jgi:hypothetical protein
MANVKEIVDKEEASCILYSWWDDVEVFYFGIGLPGREWQWRKRNPHTRAKRKSAEAKGTFRVLVEKINLTWSEACSLEKEKIAQVGMIKNGGTLTNYAEGGEGGNTMKGWDEERKTQFINKMKEVNSSRPKSSYSGTKGTMWINNGVDQTRIKQENQIPEGWQRGRLPHKGSLSTGGFWITNGKDNIFVPLGDPIPINLGWHRGQTKSHYRGKSL